MISKYKRIMNLEKYVVVSGIPGVHKLVSTRSNGLIIEDRNEDRTRFVAVRQNPVTPLGTIGIYVDNDEGGDTISLGEVFLKMEAALEANPLPDASKANSAEMRAYFTAVLPEHDQDRVHANDIKKCIKWFAFMHSHNMIEEAKKATEAPVDAATEAELPADTAIATEAESK
ncbi:MAG: hypothetical protein RIR11_4724 [Bacteroidota bacterium]|jgi:hypothetical protein